LNLSPSWASAQIQNTVREGRRQEAQDDGTGSLVQQRRGRRGDDRREAARSGEEGRRVPLGSELGRRRRGRLAPGEGPDDGAAVPVPGAPTGTIALRAAPGCAGAVMDGAAEERVPARRRRWRGAGAHGGRRPRRRGVREVLPESRWRKNVRMPSRFYVQHVQVIDAGQE